MPSESGPDTVAVFAAHGGSAVEDGLPAAEATPGRAGAVDDRGAAGLRRPSAGRSAPEAETRPPTAR